MKGKYVFLYNLFLSDINNERIATFHFICDKNTFFNFSLFAHINDPHHQNCRGYEDDMCTLRHHWFDVQHNNNGSLIFVQRIHFLWMSNVHIMVFYLMCDNLTCFDCTKLPHHNIFRGKHSYSYLNNNELSFDMQ